MKRQTQVILYHLLPAVFWLLAIGGALVPLLLWTDIDGSSNYNYHYGFLVSVLVLVCIGIIRRIKRHSTSMEECFQVALLLGVASYWLPTVLFLIIPIWVYLIYQNLFSFRSWVATLIGWAVVAVWAAVLVATGYIANPWADFFATENALGWIPLGAILLAWLASTIARQTLRVR